MRRISQLLLAVLMLVSLCACGKDGGDGGQDTPQLPENSEQTAIELVRGRLDSLYKNTDNETYMSVMGLSQDQRRQEFDDNMSEQVGYFARYFEIDNVTDDLNAQITRLWTEVYARTDYTVGGAEPLDDGVTYAVSVEIRPLDLILLMEENREAALAPFYQKYGGSDMDSMSDEQYAQADALWAQCIMNLALEQVENMGTLDPETIAVLVTYNGDGSWTVSDNDIYTADELMVSFP